MRQAPQWRNPTANRHCQGTIPPSRRPQLVLRGPSEGEEVTKKLLAIGSVKRKLPSPPRHQEKPACGQAGAARARNAGSQVRSRRPALNTPTGLTFQEIWLGVVRVVAARAALAAVARAQLGACSAGALAAQKAAACLQQPAAAPTLTLSRYRPNAPAVSKRSLSLFSRAACLAPVLEPIPQARTRCAARKRSRSSCTLAGSHTSRTCLSSHRSHAQVPASRRRLTLLLCALAVRPAGVPAARKSARQRAARLQHHNADTMHAGTSTPSNPAASKATASALPRAPGLARAELKLAPGEQQPHKHHAQQHMRLPLTRGTGTNNAMRISTHHQHQHQQTPSPLCSALHQHNRCVCPAKLQLASSSQLSSHPRRCSISAAAAPTTAALAAPLPRTPRACTSSASSTTNIPAGRRSPSTGSFQQLDVVAAPATPKCPQVSSSSGASSASSTSASCARSASTLLTAQQRSPDSVSIEGEPQPRTLKAPHNASFRRHCELHACARSASAAPATPRAR